MSTIEIKLLNPLAKVPQYATPGSAAIDLCAVNFLGEDFDSATFFTRNELSFGTGIAVHINDPGIVGLVDGRSGLGIKYGIRLSNCVGVIDSDYQGEIIVSLYNDSDLKYTVKQFDRIAQLLFVPVIRPNFIVVSEFSAESERGVNGFGSTGK